MVNAIVEQRALLERLENTLSDMLAVLIGKQEGDKKCSAEDGCFVDTVRQNSLAIKHCLALASKIEDVFTGKPDTRSAPMSDCAWEYEGCCERVLVPNRR